MGNCIASTRFGVFVAAVLLVAAPNAQSPDIELESELRRMTEWLAAVRAHEPGNPGRAAVEVSTWSGAELESVIASVKRHARSVAKTQPDNANDLLLLGATMHADIAQMIPTEMVRRSPKQQSTYIVSDGREQGTRFISIHWELGRSLLDGLLPGPAAHPAALRWYQDTSMNLLRVRSLAEAVVHLPRARKIFPSDAVLLFASGVLHERLSSAALQAAAASVIAANRGATSLNPARAELRRAEGFFREALAAQPDNLEARVRHGRVLGALGQHKEAAEELRMAIQGGAAGELLYFAELFLGREEDASGDMVEARAHYERAALLYPRAQSPRLALSQLSRRAGDRAGAQRHLQTLVALPQDQRQREDPWWNYYDVR